MNFQIYSLLAFATVIPALIGLIRISVLLRYRFFPLLACIAIGFLNESLSYSLVMASHSNHLNSNIYVLVAFLLLLWQVRNWNVAAEKKYIFPAILGVLVWVADNVILHSLRDNNSLFRLVSSGILLYCFLSRLNKYLWREKKVDRAALPVILICVGYIIHFSCKLSVELITALESAVGTEMLIQSYIIFACVNLVTYVCISAGFLLVSRNVPVYSLS